MPIKYIWLEMQMITHAYKEKIHEYYHTRDTRNEMRDSVSPLSHLAQFFRQSDLE